MTAQTDLAVQRNELAEAVLRLSYELEHPQTLIKAYEAKGTRWMKIMFRMDDVWTRFRILLVQATQ